ncbi:hypothetical protein HYDPIDRAFT_27732 [Hydnomerulius pinastri MD-312]|uniref:Uncharacterized protein n=1 Tax=Hydnomerulius pinastri MD-312 TaxID=994086 RepID=A0A0C9W213_9AGAM|nr:hypothetical protein HYDPIDRAFT_34616 [Hydnomerulius pinastri MD-312]KIJ64995.1 hypothetical protein HYDPIDRAFT_27732 [Hydnomerulius pinastri MD-312]
MFVKVSDSQLTAHKYRPCLLVRLQTGSASHNTEQPMQSLSPVQVEWLKVRADEHRELIESNSYWRLYPLVSEQWLQEFDERQPLFPNIPDDVPLTNEQLRELETAISKHMKDVRTWFRLRALNVHKPNRPVKEHPPPCRTQRTQSRVDIYANQNFLVLVQPLLDARAARGDLIGAGAVVTEAWQVCENRLAQESDEVKSEIEQMYRAQDRQRYDQLFSPAFALLAAVFSIVMFSLAL